MFDDRITVESPGSLPGIVRLNNLRTVHFSRNPKIAEFLHQYDYVKEFGEGVDRMFNEMENAGLPDPEYTDNAFMLNVTIRNGELSGELNGELNPALLYLNKSELAVYHLIENAPQGSRQGIADYLSNILNTRISWEFRLKLIPSKRHIVTTPAVWAYLKDSLIIVSISDIVFGDNPPFPSSRPLFNLLETKRSINGVLILLIGYLPRSGMI